MEIQTEVTLKDVEVEVIAEGSFGSSPFGEVEVYIDRVVATAARKGKDLADKLGMHNEALICERLLEAYGNRFME